MADFTNINGYTCKDVKGREELDELREIVGDYAFYPKPHATLDDTTRVESDTMKVLPVGGSDYYPYVYLGAKPYGSQEDFEPVGKYFEGQETEYLVGIFLDLIDMETGESATGYPQRVAASQANYSILSGGWARIKAWSLNTSSSQVQVSVTIERYNSTYTKPVENTYNSSNVPTGALDAYLNTEYYIDRGTGSGNVGFIKGLVERNATSLIIPDYVESIGYFAFSGFSTLTNVVIPDSVKSIGSNAFGSCSSLTSISIPNTVTAIDSGAFVSCTQLQNITLPNSLITIGASAFSRCSSLTSISIPNTVTSIGNTTFEGCTQLQNIRLSDSLTTIGVSAFEFCSSLTSISIPNTVTWIKSSAFYGCTSLQTITIDKAEDSISGAPWGAPNTTQIIWNG